MESDRRGVSKSKHMLTETHSNFKGLYHDLDKALRYQTIKKHKGVPKQPLWCWEENECCGWCLMSRHSRRAFTPKKLWDLKLISKIMALVLNRCITTLEAIGRRCSSQAWKLFQIHLPHLKARLRARRCLFTFPLRRQKWAHEFKTIELPEPAFAPLYLPHTHYDLWVVITSLPVTSSHHASRTKVTN